MKIDHPATQDIPALRHLWTAAFGDTGEFLDSFFAAGYAPERALALYENGVLGAALYWFDCSFEGEKAAYIYAVATDPVYRGRGFCRSLMEKARELLTEKGYALSLLVPGNEGLSRMYAGMGYIPCTRIREFSATAGGEALPLRQVCAAEYGPLREKLLPSGSVLQEGENLSFLQTCTCLYAGENVLLAAELSQKDARIVEFLGEEALAPAVLAALGKETGSFRTAGDQIPFAMALPLKAGAPLPTYFGLAFD